MGQWPQASNAVAPGGPGALAQLRLHCLQPVQQSFASGGPDALVQLRVPCLLPLPWLNYLLLPGKAVYRAGEQAACRGRQQPKRRLDKLQAGDGATPLPLTTPKRQACFAEAL